MFLSICTLHYLLVTKGFYSLVCNTELPSAIFGLIHFFLRPLLHPLGDFTSPYIYEPFDFSANFLRHFLVVLSGVIWGSVTVWLLNRKLKKETEKL